MKKLILILMGIFINHALYAQMAIISSRDGFSNLRTAPSLESVIITPLQSNTVVLVDENYQYGYMDTKWFKVYLGKDPYCTNCTPNLEEQHLSGYVHRSQIKNIEKLSPAGKKDFRMHYTFKKFDPSDKKIIYIKNTSNIASINGRPYFGSDCGTPETEISSAEAFVKGREFPLPMDMIWGILHASDNFSYYKNGNTYFAIQRVGDGACMTEVAWVFDRQGLKQRMLGNNY